MPGEENDWCGSDTPKTSRSNRGKVRIYSVSGEIELRRNLLVAQPRATRRKNISSRGVRATPSWGRVAVPRWRSTRSLTTTSASSACGQERDLRICLHQCRHPAVACTGRRREVGRAAHVRTQEGSLDAGTGTAERDTGHDPRRHAINPTLEPSPTRANGISPCANATSALDFPRRTSRFRSVLTRSGARAHGLETATLKGYILPRTDAQREDQGAGPQGVRISRPDGSRQRTAARTTADIRVGPRPPEAPRPARLGR